MKAEANQNLLFGSEINPPLGWRAYATSMVVHIVALILLLLIPVAVTQVIERANNHVLLVAPELKRFVPKQKIQTPKLLAKSVITPKPIPEVKPKITAPPPPVTPPPPVVQETPKPVPQPEVAAAAPKPVPHITAEPTPAPALRPQVHTGAFASEQAAKQVDRNKQLAVGGFGDPNGAKASADTKTPQLIARAGAFDLPQGDGASGARGGQGRGTVRSTAFGSSDGAGSGPGGSGSGIGHGTVRSSGFGSPDGGNGNGTGGNGHGGSVKTGGFGENAAAATQTVRPKVTTPATTPVEILSKPRPIYTAEARSLGLEGEVSLQVLFSASGSVQVLSVIRGLGHGLDEAAQQAASQIRFRPGTRDGVPVDTTATIHIVFALT